MRERLLVRHFLWRFLEHDLVSPTSDRRGILSAVAGALVAASLFLSVLVAYPYWFFNFMPPGIASVQSLEDRFLFTSASMLVMALAAVAQWDALVLDARDTAVLGVLPLPRALIVRSKFIATALFAAAVLAAWNLFPTLFRAASLPLLLPIGFAGTAWLTLAHAGVTIAAVVFGFLAVLGLREVTFAILGARGFHRISAALQASLIVVLTTALLMLPGASAFRWLTPGSAAAKALPPIWFVGLHEKLAGSVIDSLPRRPLPRFMMRQELAATNRYRPLWPLFDELAVIAVVALLLVAAVTVAACWWNSRRLPNEAGHALSRSSALSRAWNWIVGHLWATTPLRQAGLFFTLQTLTRQVTHRVTSATAFAVGLAMVLVVAGGGRLSGVNGVESIPVSILAAQTLLLGSLLSGFRRATRMASELRASSTFSLCWLGNASPYISGVKRAGWIAVVAPALAGLGIWHTAILGARLAALHFGVGVLISGLFVEVLFFRCRRLPFVEGDTPSADVKLRVFGSLAALLFVSFSLAWIERSSFGTASEYVTLLAILAGLTVGVAAFDRVFTERILTLDLEEPLALPTQRLNLAE